MRISKIKLSGFKSFVDPTTLALPGNLTGIVGPNGCGKSNIIDALQWVLGESSAKHLRGDSMADVVFNGSASRKPVGQAAVEIVFDNSDGSLGGQWASFAELSIKRLVNRDGVSAYYLNGARSRRRDITDIFLGTGVGSNGYSVIAQGMISRVIEAKPEDLRLFLEEAAGISKYKDRRRETESRMQKAAENLSRLEDIRGELDKQLDRLQQQARAAEKYQVLKAEERQLSAELIALAWRDLDQQFHAQTQRAVQCETRLEGGIARLRAIEAQIEHEREQQVAATAVFNDVQGRFYAAGADIARAEQGIQYGKERHSALENDLRRAEQEFLRAGEQATMEQQQFVQLTAELAALEPRRDTRVSEEAEAKVRLQDTEQALQLWQTEWDSFNQQANEALRDERGENTRLQHLEGSLSQLMQRLQGLRAEAESLILDDLQIDVAALEDRKEHLASQADSVGERRVASQRTLQELNAQIETLNQQLHVEQGELQTCKGRAASLEALQQAAYSVDDDHLQKWLQEHGELADLPRLAQGLEVERGWEVAVETVLGQFLEALQVPNLDTFAEAAAHLDRGSLALVELGGDTRSAAPADGLNAIPSLASKVSGAAALQGLLGSINAVADVATALALRPRLGATESIVLQDGTWLGRHWLRVTRSSNAMSGILKREQELKELRARTAQLEETVVQYEEAAVGLRQQLQELTASDAELQRELGEIQRQLTQTFGEHAAKQTQFEQASLRRARINNDIGELETRADLEKSELENVRLALSEIRELIKHSEERRAEFNEQREQRRAEVQSAREAWTRARDENHALALRAEALRSQIAALESSLERNRTQAEQQEQRCVSLRESLAASDTPLSVLQEELAAALELRGAVETELGEARAQLQHIDELLRNDEQSRNAYAQEIDGLRTDLEQARVQTQTQQVRLQAYTEQLAGIGCELETVLAALPEAVEKSAWEERLAAVERRIARLGPINLAAIDECRELSERKVYLDSQHADLTEALATLEGAIRHIDLETKTRFNETFEKVNEGFKAKFPALFGGGQAYLELTGDDLLETGVTVMARPPGKRNSTIHLLSGGEKALTAVALVFSIFDLNPAPFCLLDEVDAPLDDANVVHLCNMLRQMSERVQFLFITHNKITMEIAQRLVGVTMHEPGVSRLVAVDVDDAVRLAAAG